MLWPLPCVSVYPHSWSVRQVALLDTLEPLYSYIVEEQEGALTNTLAMVVKLAIRSLPLLRTGAMVALQGGGLVAVSHDLSHYEQIQLVMGHLGKGGSE